MKSLYKIFVQMAAIFILLEEYFGSSDKNFLILLMHKCVELRELLLYIIQRVRKDDLLCQG